MKIKVRNISQIKRVFGFDKKQVFELGVGVTAGVEPNEESLKNIERFKTAGLIAVEDAEAKQEVVEAAPVIPERKPHDPISDLKSDKKSYANKNESKRKKDKNVELPAEPEKIEASVDSPELVVDNQN
jgi:hypothetical protein